VLLKVLNVPAETDIDWLAYNSVGLTFLIPNGKVPNSDIELIYDEYLNPQDFSTTTQHCKSLNAFVGGIDDPIWNQSGNLCKCQSNTWALS